MDTKTQGADKYTASAYFESGTVLDPGDTVKEWSYLQGDDSKVGKVITTSGVSSMMKSPGCFVGEHTLGRPNLIMHRDGCQGKLIWEVTCQLKP